jgi:S-adenosylmethionine hydrolase
MKPLSNSKIILMNNFGNLYALNCLVPFDDDFFVTLNLNVQVKAFDVISSFLDQQEKERIAILNSNNQLLISNSLGNLFQKDSFDLNCTDVFLFANPIQQFNFISKDCLFLNFKEQNEILLFK